ncbi:hypothetical protein [Mycolicibacterium goodii]|uniref:Uncharacterized protein n=1 Tax=Mycolicibacterium goodii TaxID=134601 RepID=A0A0K0X3Q1_MYCGD|nr:hypothetical protein AFA91_09630 [Mycolicibacterium goodii]
MSQLKSIGVAAVCTAAGSMTFFSNGIAAADDYAGKTYTDASSVASNARQTVIVATRIGSILAQPDCIVTSSQKAPFLHGTAHVQDTVLFHLNCNGGYATTTTPGASLLSPQGREAKTAADEAAAQAGTPDA